MSHYVVKISAVFGLLLFAVTGCDSLNLNQNVVRGSGTIVEEVLELSGFNAVAVSGSQRVNIVSGRDFSVIVRADDNILPLLTHEINGSILSLGSKPNTSTSPSRPVEYTIVLPELTEVTNSGSAEVITDSSFDSNGFRAVLSGSGLIELSELNAEHIECTISGSGSIVVRGDTHRLTATITGSGSLDSRDLLAEDADVRISGDGNATVYASNDLDVIISGSGDVHYRGDATLSQRIVGTGNISRLE